MDFDKILNNEVYDDLSVYDRYGKLFSSGSLFNGISDKTFKKIIDTKQYICLFGFVFKTKYEYSKEIVYDVSSIVTNDNIMSTDNAVKKPTKHSFTFFIDNPTDLLDMIIKSSAFNINYSSLNFFGFNPKSIWEIITGLMCLASTDNSTGLQISNALYILFKVVNTPVDKLPIIAKSGGLTFNKVIFEKDYGNLIDNGVLDNIFNLIENFTKKYSTFFIANSEELVYNSGVLQGNILDGGLLGTIQEAIGFFNKIPAFLVFDLLELFLDIRKNLPVPLTVHLPQKGWINCQISNMRYSTEIKSDNILSIEVTLEEYQPVTSKFISTAGGDSVGGGIFNKKPNNKG